MGRTQPCRRERGSHGLLRLARDQLQMVLTSEALGIDLVDGVRSRRPDSKPPVPSSPSRPTGDAACRHAQHALPRPAHRSLPHRRTWTASGLTTLWRRCQGSSQPRASNPDVGTLAESPNLESLRRVRVLEHGLFGIRSNPLGLCGGNAIVLQCLGRSTFRVADAARPPPRSLLSNLGEGHSCSWSPSKVAANS